MSKAQVNKVKKALQNMEESLEQTSRKINDSTEKLKKCKKNIKAHVQKLKDMREALIKNKLSTNMMVKEGYIDTVDEYTEMINGIFNSLIHSAENILED
tara:strand:- start:617 stop:913 length:297 start_codon:yes stop_codon:yes gene_type:complete